MEKIVLVMKTLIGQEICIYASLNVHRYKILLDLEQTWIRINANVNKVHIGVNKV